MLNFRVGGPNHRSRDATLCPVNIWATFPSECNPLKTCQRGGGTGLCLLVCVGSESLTDCSGELQQGQVAKQICSIAAGGPG